MARIKFWTAVRAGIVLLLMGTMVSGFSEPEGLTLGTTVSGTPTVGILGGAAANGSQISGQVISIDTVQSPPLVMLATTSGQVWVLMSDPLMGSTLYLGSTATFEGSYLTADVFSAFRLLANPILAGDPGAGPQFGAPLDEAALVATATVSTTNQTNSSVSYSTSIISADNSDNSDDCESDSSDNSDNTDSSDNSDDCATPTPTPTPTACLATLKVALNPYNKTRTAGTSHSVGVSVDTSGNCSGQLARLKVESGANSGTTASPKALNDDNETTLSYTGATSGEDTFRVWVDLNSDGVYDSGSEPSAQGTVTWNPAPTATPTRTPSPTPNSGESITVKKAGARVAEGGATATPTKTPNPTKTPTPAKTGG